MEQRQRVILYGDSLILETVGASLQKRPQLEVIALSNPCPSAGQLAAMKPDVILFDMGTPRPEAAFSLLATCPGLLLVGVDPDRNRAVAWSGQQLCELSVQDLVEVIQSRSSTRRDAETQ